MTNKNGANREDQHLLDDDQSSGNQENLDLVISQVALIKRILILAGNYSCWILRRDAHALNHHRWIYCDTEPRYLRLLVKSCHGFVEVVFVF